MVKIKTIKEGRRMSDYPGDHIPHPIDVSLGARIRLRRRELGLSQDQLAKEIGITFQQVQKYEHGTNRVSFSRLVEIAAALSCNVIDLIAGLDNSKASASLSRHIAYLNEPGAGDLLEAYGSIRPPKRRKAILNLARQLADDDMSAGEMRHGKGFSGSRD
jgi:transcriptional regulator with XRE-family HTH domain